MKISCIIPTCDRKLFLIEAINSVLKQNIQPAEIIIVNNGKNSICLPEKTAKKVKIHNIVFHAGAAQARNFGAAVAQGDYLAFLDDDDLWEKKYLEKVSEAIELGAECVISRLDKMVDGEISSFKNAHGKLKIENILIQNPGITGTNIVISKKVFFRIGGFNTKLPPSEDKSLILEVLINGEKIVTLPDNQTIQRFHNKERLITDAEKMAEGIYQFTRKYRKLMNSKQFLFNWLKIYHYRYQAGIKIAGAQYFIIRIFYYFFKMPDYIAIKLKIL